MNYLLLLLLLMESDLHYEDTINNTLSIYNVKYVSASKKIVAKYSKPKRTGGFTVRAYDYNRLIRYFVRVIA